MGEEQEETVVDGFGQMPIRNVIIIFIATFLMIFVVFMMIEPSLVCDSGEGSLFTTGCESVTFTQEFFFGIAIAGILFIFDMIIVYMTLSEYFM